MRGPRHVVSSGETPLLNAVETARVSAGSTPLIMRGCARHGGRECLYAERANGRLLVRLREKGGNRQAMLREQPRRGEENRTPHWSIGETAWDDANPFPDTNSLGCTIRSSADADPAMRTCAGYRATLPERRRRTYPWRRPLVPRLRATRAERKVVRWTPRLGRGMTRTAPYPALLDRRGLMKSTAVRAAGCCPGALARGGEGSWDECSQRR